MMTAQLNTRVNFTSSSRRYHEKGFHFQQSFGETIRSFAAETVNFKFHFWGFRSSVGSDPGNLWGEARKSQRCERSSVYGAWRVQSVPAFYAPAREGLALALIKLEMVDGKIQAFRHLRAHATPNLHLSVTPSFFSRYQVSWTAVLRQSSQGNREKTERILCTMHYTNLTNARSFPRRSLTPAIFGFFTQRADPLFFAQQKSSDFRLTTPFRTDRRRL